MGGRGGPGSNFFWSCQIWGQKKFPLFSALDSISAGGRRGGLGPNFFWSCQIWSQKLFPLFSTLDSISAVGGGGIWDPTFLGHVKFEIKNFSLYIVSLDSISTSAGWGWEGGVGLGPNFFWSCQIWGQKFFPLFSTWDPSFVGHAKFEVKNFSLYLVLWSLFPQGRRGVWDPIFLIMPNLRSKSFPFI